MTAGIYAARKKLKTLILTENVGGQMVYSGNVENYSGFSAISGVDLTAQFRRHLETIPEDLELLEGKKVTLIDKNIVSFSVEDSSGKTYYAKAIIICSGRTPKSLGVAGEQKFLGKGVSVCAVCDAPLYKNKDVAVVGGGNSAMDALFTLSKLARRIYSIHPESRLAGDEVLKSKISGNAAITFFPESKIVEILGDKVVSGIKIIKPVGEQILPVQGVFIEIGWKPETSFDRLTRKNYDGEIIVDQNMQTNVPGLFAAGDVNNAWGEQIVIASGEGAKAAIAAASYIARLK